MKQYWKAGQIVERPKSLVFNGITYIPPTDEILIEAGYEIIDFTREDVCPYNLREGLEALGYIYEDREDNNYDYWWYFVNKHHYLCITFNAESFNLKMFFVEEEV